MGCIWSSSDADQCRHCQRRAVNNLIVINHQCEVCIRQATRPKSSVKLRACFGEYKCVCGHRWHSRKSWENKYQECIRCRKPVFAFNQRELRPSDMIHDKDNVQEHQRDLCQMCKEIGYYCGDMGKQKTTGQARQGKTKR